MSDNLEAVVRDRVGKGAAREMRRKGYVPAVIYGDKKAPMSIALPVKEVTLAANSGGFATHVIKVKVDGKLHTVIPKDVQRDPIKDTPIHIDFLRLTKGGTLNIDIPVHFINEEECPGIKIGGILNVVRHDVECEVPVENVPESFIFDLTGLEIGDSLHISDITLPEGVVPDISDRDFTIATIVAPAVLEVDTVVEDEAVEVGTDEKAADGDDAAEGEGE